MKNDILKINYSSHYHSLGSLSSFRQLLHHLDEFVRPVAGGADVDAEEVFLGGGGHGEGVPLQRRNGRAVEEDVLAHLHLEALLHQLQFQHFGGPHYNLTWRQGSTLIKMHWEIVWHYHTLSLGSSTTITVHYLSWL